jgi:hypothetical protein
MSLLSQSNVDRTTVQAMQGLFQLGAGIAAATLSSSISSTHQQLRSATAAAAKHHEPGCPCLHCDQRRKMEKCVEREARKKQSVTGGLKCWQHYSCVQGRNSIARTT